MWTYKAGTYYRPKEQGRYPWPCADQPDRTIELLDDDVLTKDTNTGTFMVHTGIGCFGIVLTDDQVVLGDKDIHLTMV